MRYKYRVRLFYSIIFLLVGLVLGYKLAGYGIDLNISDIKNIFNANPDIVSNPQQDKPGIKSTEQKIIGILLPKSEENIKSAIGLALMQINAENNENISVIYERAECSPVDIKRAFDDMKLKNINYAYAAVCNEVFGNIAINAIESKIITLVPSFRNDLVDNFSGMIKIKIYSNLTQESNRFIMAYKALYKRTPDTHDGISYDAINIIRMMMNDNKVIGYNGVLGVADITKEENPYLLMTN